MTPSAFAPAGSARVTVVIVTRGAWAWTQRALAALHRYTPDVEVVIVDNASRDGTPERLVREVEEVRLVANADNVGFARAANQGAELAGGELVAFLNNDALVHDGWLAPLVEAVDRDARVAAAGPRLLNLDGSLQEAGGARVSPRRRRQYGSPPWPVRTPKTVTPPRGPFPAPSRRRPGDSPRSGSSWPSGWSVRSRTCGRSPTRA